MRTYIFTETERRAIRLLLDRKISPSDPKVAYIRSRVKSFEALAEDVELYLRLRGLAESEAT